MWRIYKHTLLISEHAGWSYIGQTCRSLEDRWGKNGEGYRPETYFGRVISKYGWSNFSHEIIEDNILSLEEANERESYWISYYHTWVDDPNCRGFNLDSGGNSHIPSSVSRLKNSLKQKGVKKSPQACLRMSQAKKGIHHTEEYNARLSKKMGGKDIICIETQKIYHGKCAAQRLTSIRHIDEVCCHYRETAGGYHWAYVDDLESQEKYKEFVNKDRSIKKLAKRKILCVEYDLIFESISEANRWCKNKFNCGLVLHRLPDGTLRKACGMHWKFIDDKNSRNITNN